MKYTFVNPSDLMNLSDGQRIGWLAPADNSDFVERAGYRTIAQQVHEMMMAGERLADWREAAYPVGTDLTGLDPVPIFGDELEILDRYRALRDLRAQRQVYLEEDVARWVKAKADAEAAALEASKPLSVRVVTDPV